jgi:membrane-bound lytic murein transglycosylase B
MKPSALLLVAALVLVGAMAAPATGTTPAAPTTAAAPAAEPPPPVTDPRLSAALDAVAVSSPAYDRAEHTYTGDWTRLGQAQARAAAASTQLTQLATQETNLSADLAAAVRRHGQAQAAVAQMQASVRTLAVALFVQGGPDPTDLSVLDPASSDQVQRSQVLIETVSQGRLATLRVNQAIVEATHARATLDLTGLADVNRRQAAAGAALAQAQRDQTSINAALGRDRTNVADTRLTAAVTGTDLSLVVLDAYWRAAATIATLQPACHLSWPALAGIGRVESGNGTFGGDSVGATGEEATPIIGIPLDGTNGTQLVGDTDHGALDHDTVYDRAVGPMQVLPSAWRRYGRDGNGDGQADPQNIDDAALAAAVMLCRYGALDTDAGLSTTFFHYNPSNAYVAEVLGYTHAYQSFAVPPV